MSKILLVNGSNNQKGCTFVALSEMKKVFEKNGIEAEILFLGNAPIADCMGCQHCSEKGECVFNDIVNKVAKNLDEYDGIVLGSPVYYAGPTARICAFANRLFYSVPRRKFKYKLGACVVSCRRGGNSASFDRLNKYFTISNMIVVGSQYWNMIHGFTSEDAKKDLEGLQTIRTLAENMSYVLKCLKAGEKLGVEKPVEEKQLVTNFMDGK